MKTVSLHTRLLFATLIPVTSFVILFGIFTVMLRFQDIDDLQMRNAEVLVEKFRAEALGSSGPGQWREMTQAALESPYIRSISILDKDRQVVAHGGPLLKTVFGKLPAKTSFQNYPAPDGASYLLALSPFSYGSANYWLAIELRPAPFTIARYQSAIITSFSAFIMLFVLALILLVIWSASLMLTNLLKYGQIHHPEKTHPAAALLGRYRRWLSSLLRRS